MQIKFQVENFRGHDFTGGRISHFLLIFAWALQQCSATALPVMCIGADFLFWALGRTARIGARGGAHPSLVDYGTPVQRQKLPRRVGAGGDLSHQMQTNFLSFCNFQMACEKKKNYSGRVSSGCELKLY